MNTGIKIFCIMTVLLFAYVGVLWAKVNHPHPNDFMKWKYAMIFPCPGGADHIHTILVNPVEGVEPKTVEVVVKPNHAPKM